MFILAQSDYLTNMNSAAICDFLSGIAGKIVDVSSNLNYKLSNLGATVSVYIGQPLDTIKTKLQTYPHRYKNFIDCAQKIFYKDGMRGLYAGTLPSLLANAAGSYFLRKF
jgi:solute carrier family 25 ornithine transporter 2/15